MLSDLIADLLFSTLKCRFKNTWIRWLHVDRLKIPRYVWMANKFLSLLYTAEWRVTVFNKVSWIGDTTK